MVSDARRNNTVGTIGALGKSRTTRRLEPSSDDFVAEGVGFSADCHAKTERSANKPVLLAPSSSPDRHPGYGPAMEDGDIDAPTMTMVAGGVYVQYCTAYQVYIVRQYMSLISHSYAAPRQPLPACVTRHRTTHADHKGTSP